jgi:hypothetical protein
MNFSLVEVLTPLADPSPHTGGSTQWLSFPQLSTASELPSCWYGHCQNRTPPTIQTFRSPSPRPTQVTTVLVLYLAQQDRQPTCQGTTLRQLPSLCRWNNLYRSCLSALRHCGQFFFHAYRQLLLLIGGPHWLGKCTSISERRRSVQSSFLARISSALWPCVVVEPPPSYQTKKLPAEYSMCLWSAT